MKAADIRKGLECYANVSGERRPVTVVSVRGTDRYRPKRRYVIATRGPDGQIGRVLADRPRSARELHINLRGHWAGMTESLANETPADATHVALTLAEHHGADERWRLWFVKRELRRGHRITTKGGREWLVTECKAVQS